MHVLAVSLTFGMTGFLVLAIGLALVFEMVNGFHDTANAVATVIYTHSLPPWVAVIWSGLWNLIGVLCSTGAVAFSVMALLPGDLVMNIGSSTAFAMVFALLISAILWNLGTWYLGLPASSSHTLIGSIMGVGLANSMLVPGHAFGEGVNWSKATEVFSSLLFSPVVGFICAAVLLLLMKALIQKKSLYTAPTKNAPPPLYIRALLVLTCTGVSFAHGSNDGQKGMGLILLILIGILPGTYALNMGADAAQIQKLEASANFLAAGFDSHAGAVRVTDKEASDILGAYTKTNGKMSDRTFPAVALINHALAADLKGKASFRDLPEGEVNALRNKIYLLSATITKLKSENQIKDPAEDKALAEYKSEMTAATQYIPTWVKFAVALALGLGTMVGWKRIVVTVGEKIGKEHLTYAQGASAEIVAFATIGLATQYGMPVSTTHVLTSGVAGTMAANRSGLQMATLRNLMLAWVLTLPVCLILGAAAFSAGLFIIFHNPLEKTLFIAGLAAVAAAVWWLWRTFRKAGNKEAAQVESATSSAD